VTQQHRLLLKAARGRSTGQRPPPCGTEATEGYGCTREERKGGKTESGAICNWMRWMHEKAAEQHAAARGQMDGGAQDERGAKFTVVGHKCSAASPDTRPLPPCSPLPPSPPPACSVPVLCSLPLRGGRTSRAKTARSGLTATPLFRRNDLAQTARHEQKGKGQENGTTQ
jgi:hypothetical protein